MSRYIYNQRHNSSNKFPAVILILLILSLSIVATMGWSTPAGHKIKSIRQIKVQKPPVTGVVSVSGASWVKTADITTLLVLTNQYRLQNGLNDLKLSDQLDISASNKCKDMVDKDYWSHNDPAGLEPWHFMSEAGYLASDLGENLAYGFLNNKDVIRGWINSLPHRKNLLNVDYKDIGFGICESQNYIHEGHQSIVVQHFGTPLP